MLPKANTFRVPKNNVFAKTKLVQSKFIRERVVHPPNYWCAAHDSKVDSKTKTFCQLASFSALRISPASLYIMTHWRCWRLLQRLKRCLCSFSAISFTSLTKTKQLLHKDSYWALDNITKKPDWQETPFNLGIYSHIHKPNLSITFAFWHFVVP